MTIIARRHKLIVMAQPMGAIHTQIIGQLYAPTPDMTDIRFFLALAALENNLVSGADKIPMLLLKPMHLHRYASCKLISNFVNGGATKVSLPFLKAWWFLFSKISMQSYRSTLSIV